VQYSVALVIFATYIIAMLDSQMQPEEGSHAANTFRILEIVFTIVFGIELAINMFAHWWTPFWESRWNIFDFLVVGCSVLSLIIPALPGISVLRLLRVFKMIRLFQQLQSLRVLINALSTSVLPVLNAFVVLLLVTSIYGMLQQIH
jgi:voltage-gated sodium channel